MYYHINIVFCDQMLTIHLEETDCFAAWVSAKEVGMAQTNDGTDTKCE